MRVLVTGGAGFIASHVVDRLIAEGHDVAVVDDLSTGRRENVNPRAHFYLMDVRNSDLAAVFAEHRPAVVNHHAAQMSVRVSVQRPIYDAEVNVVGTLNVIENCLRHGVGKFVHISSGGAVYGEPVYLPCDEGHPIAPLCQYGVTKHVAEHYLHTYQRLHGLDYTVLRYPNVYGPRQDPRGEAGVVAIFIGQMLAGLPVTIHGSGEQERDYVYVGDVVRANLAALTKGGGAIYNLGTGVGTSVNRLFRALAELIGYRQPPRYGPAKAGETFRIFLEASKARRELRWSPLMALHEGLERTVRFHQDLLERSRTSRAALLADAENPPAVALRAGEERDSQPCMR